MKRKVVYVLVQIFSIRFSTICKIANEKALTASQLKSILLYNGKGMSTPGLCPVQNMTLGLERFRIFTVRFDFDSHTLDSIFFESVL